MSHITLLCILCVKIDFSLDSDSKYHKDQEKKDCIFYRSIKVLKWRNPRWPTKYIKINTFTYNFATVYAEDINNMSILMSSGMRKPFFSFVFRKKYCKVYIYANIKKTRISESESGILCA